MLLFALSDQASSIRYSRWLQIGICYGKLQRKRPTAIGAADYYGVVANTAARVMGLAQPGQILIEGNLPLKLKRTQRQTKVEWTIPMVLEGLDETAAVSLVRFGDFCQYFVGHFEGAEAVKQGHHGRFIFRDSGVKTF